MAVEQRAKTISGRNLGINVIFLEINKRLLWRPLCQIPCADERAVRYSRHVFAEVRGYDGGDVRNEKKVRGRGRKEVNTEYSLYGLRSSVT